MTNALNRLVRMIIKIRELYARKLGIANTKMPNARYDSKLMTRLIAISSCTTRDNFLLSSLTFAQARIPYVGIPSCESIRKYDTNEVANDTRPVPSGRRMRDTYGKVISGKINDESVRMVFIM